VVLVAPAELLQLRVFDRVVLHGRTERLHLLEERRTVACGFAYEEERQWDRVLRSKVSSAGSRTSPVVDAEEDDLVGGRHVVERRSGLAEREPAPRAGARAIVRGAAPPPPEPSGWWWSSWCLVLVVVVVDDD